MIDKPAAEDSRELDWFKSSYSDSSSGNDCVEVAASPAAVHVRDSKNTPGPRLGFTPATWTAFLTYASRR
ncbi:MULTISPECIES: DUF397 domain-containing protein [unclassified Streptomyces]|uniref:DUF397 domain-containing protein n=1 Tax=unclassified Streptomyces TaxID=2593676 RepID=UPI00093F0761|nr:DUF397 domain-containing protein [Streptomyces sp. CB02058]OKI96228.1 toxin [Streptomyces sp. CB02058]